MVAEKKSDQSSIIKELQEQIKILKHINDENAFLIKHDSTDQLTGLLKKDAFFRETNRLLHTYPKSTFLFFRFDIDKFQTINTLFGYDEGDKLLIYCAKILSKIRKSNTDFIAGRFDADVFCCCCKVEKDEDIIPSFEETEKFLEGFRKDYRFNFSMGLYKITNTKEPLRDIYAKATLAARKCKDSSTQHYFLFDKTTDEELITQQLISSEMYRALKKEEFVPFFQPKVDLKTRQLVGAEALIRWNHPKRGLLSPSEFIPIFYSNGFITQLDLYVFKTVCSHLRKWINSGITIIPISINMSQISMMDLELPDKLFAIMDTYNIDKKYIHLEITESAYSVDTSKSIQCAVELSNRGLHLEMDDFGTGISSLTMLHELPVNTLKLDIRFIKSYSETKQNAGIIHFIGSLARQMQVGLVAEGIETENQLEFLKNIGCDTGQGYLFSKPLNAKDFKKAITSWTILEEIPEPPDENFILDMNDLWIPHSKFNILFNMIAGAAAVYEFTTNVSSVKVLKANDEYLDTMVVEKSGKHHTFNDLEKLIHLEDLKELQKRIKKIIQDQVPFSMLIRRINIPEKNGPKWIKMTIRTLFKNKTASLILAMIEDVTTQQEHIDYLERESKIHEDYKKQLLIYKTAEQSGLASIQVEKNGLTLTYANDVFLKMHGITREYALDHKTTILMNTIHPDDKKLIIKALSTVIKKKQTHFSWSMRIQSLDGSVRDTVVHGVIHYSDRDPTIDIIVRPREHFESFDNQK